MINYKRPRVRESTHAEPTGPLSPKKGLLNLKDSEFAKLFYIKFGINDAQDLIAGFAFQITNELFLYNAEDCTFWSTDSGTDIANGIFLLVEESRPFDAFTSFAYSLHKLPLALYNCKKLVVDIKMMLYFYSVAVKSAIEWGPYYLLIFWNVWFNWIDIAYEMIALFKAYEEREYTMIGTYMAKILSDVFFKSTFTESWNYQNSDILNDEWGDPLDLYNGMLRELNDILIANDYEPIGDYRPEESFQQQEEE